MQMSKRTNKLKHKSGIVYNLVPLQKKQHKIHLMIHNAVDTCCIGKINKKGFITIVIQTNNSLWLKVYIFQKILISLGTKFQIKIHQNEQCQ